MSFAVLLLALAACAKRPERTALQGTWITTEENPAQGLREESECVVAAKPPKFRIERKEISEMGVTTVVEVYDGDALHRRDHFEPGPAFTALHAQGIPEELLNRETPTFKTISEAIRPEKAQARRFWAMMALGDSSPGGLICGRDTILYETKWRRPDGEFSDQVWVDAKTRVILKSINSIYASQIGSLLRRVTTECRTIDFTAPPDTAFAIP